MRAFARFLCRDGAHADDLTQDALVSALRGRNAFTAGTNLKAWLFAIVRNQLYSDRRRAKWTAPLDPEAAARTLVALSNPMASLELADVHAAMQRLSDDQRVALTLVAVAGLSYEDAAQVCRCAQGTVKSRVNRARQRLLEILAGSVAIARKTRRGAMEGLFADAGLMDLRPAA
jgi:RNA polymerase sigma-70 factor (ECF subfamily)